MSVPPDQMQKGYFHQLTGAPFFTTLRGNATEYKALNQQLESAKKNEIEQLRLQSSIQNQHNELLTQQIVILDSLKQNNNDVAHMQMLVKQAEVNLKTVEFNSPLSLQPRIPTPTGLLQKFVGFVPVVGDVFSAYQLVNYKLQHNEAKYNLDIEKQALTDVSDFGKSTQQSFNTNTDNLLKVEKQILISKIVQPSAVDVLN